MGGVQGVLSAFRGASLLGMVEVPDLMPIVRRYPLLTGLGLTVAASVALGALRRLSGGGEARAAESPATPSPSPGLARPDSTDPMYGVYRTPILNAKPHPKGGFVAFEGMTVCALPFIDVATGLFARVSWNDAVSVAANYGARLLTYQEHERIARGGFIIEPCTLVSTTEDQKRMRSRSYAEKHDACVWERLAVSGYDGSKPVANIGKQWLSSPIGSNHGWWVPGKTLNPSRPQAILSASRSSLVPIQLGSAPKHEPTYTDYSQLLMCRKV